MKIGGEPLKEVIYLAHVHVTLGHYRNQLLHVFLQDSLVAITLEEEITCGEQGGVFRGTCGLVKRRAELSEWSDTFRRATLHILDIIK